MDNRNKESKITIFTYLDSKLSNLYVRMVIDFLAAIIAPLLIEKPIINGNNICEVLWNQRYFIIFIIFYFIILYRKYLIEKKNTDDTLNCDMSKFFTGAITIVERSIQKVNRKKAEENHENNNMMFNKAAQIVCSALFEMLNNAFPKNQIRVCITKQIMDEDNEDCIKQVGYRSPTCQYASNMEKKLKDFDYYVAEIIKSKREEYVLLLSGREVKKHLKFNRAVPHSQIPQQFIAIPFKKDLEHTCFVLQIDFRNKNTLGNNKEDVQKFLNEYIRPFVLRLGNIYYSDFLKQYEEEE